MEKQIFSGKTEEEALEFALAELEVSKDDIFYEVTEQKGGLFKAKKVEVSIIKKADVVDYLKELVKKITKLMGFEVNLEVMERDGILNITLYSDNNNVLIGKNGRNMNALSVIMKQALFNELGFLYKFNLDVGEYKVKQQKKIEHLARNVAREVKNTGIEVKLDPMNSYERRIVHNVLTNYKNVYTESYGEEPNRYVVIKPKED